MSLRPVRAALALLLGLAGLVTGIAPASVAAAAGPVQLAIAVPLVVPEGTTGLIDADTLALYTSPGGLLSRQLDSVLNRSVAIGIDPMILASIRILGVSAPQSATTWLARLASASNQTFALGYSDTDLTLAIQAGASSMLAPQSFSFAVDPTLFAAATTATPTPTPSPTSSETADPANPVFPALPSTASLISWPYSIDDVAWPREGTVVGHDLDVISSGRTATTIVSSSNLARSSGAGSVVDVTGNSVLVSDDSVSTALRSAARAASQEEWLGAMATLSTAIADAARTESAVGATLFATLDRSPGTNIRLADTLVQLSTMPGVTSIPISQAIAAAPSTATLVELRQDAPRVAMVSRLLVAEREEQQLASVADDPLAITAQRRLELLALLSNGWQPDSSGWMSAAQDFLTASGSLVSAVQVVSSSGFNLLADRASLPITVSNELDQPVTVYITVRPDTALLAVGESRVKLVIEPRSQGKGQIPVQAISNGTVRLTVSLTSTAGMPIGQPTRTKINVQAGWETPVVLLIAGLVVALFAFGLVRSVLRRRRPAAVPALD